MAATFAVRLKRIALSTPATFQTPGSCLARQWRYVETKDRCFANPQGSVGQAGPDTGLDREIHFPAASARSASAHRKHLRGAQIRRRKLQRPKSSETLALNRMPPRGPYRSPSCRWIRRRRLLTEFPQLKRREKRPEKRQ